MDFSRVPLVDADLFDMLCILRVVPSMYSTLCRKQECGSQLETWL